MVIVGVDDAAYAKDRRANVSILHRSKRRALRRKDKRCESYCEEASHGGIPYNSSGFLLLPAKDD